MNHEAEFHNYCFLVQVFFGVPKPGVPRPGALPIVHVLGLSSLNLWFFLSFQLYIYFSLQNFSGGKEVGAMTTYIFIFKFSAFIRLYVFTSYFFISMFISLFFSIN
jgi:hypothetical protein